MGETIHDDPDEDPTPASDVVTFAEFRHTKGAANAPLVAAVRAHIGLVKGDEATAEYDRQVLERAYSDLGGQ